MHITTIGLDLAKHWFQIHGVNAAGKVVEAAPMCERAVVERAVAEPCCLLKAIGCYGQ